MAEETIRDVTRSGAYYMGTPEKWSEYHSAWVRFKEDTLVDLETGNHADFYPDPSEAEKPAPTTSTTKKFIRDMTESGDYYSATAEKWEEYRKAWFDGDEDKVMFFEEGRDEDFYYDPELPVRDR